ncbi:hypothetical protein IEO21_09735 [Rhodonia placenta]|uniref:Transmembrane protein n=1 Tax=Rhodonia placenta TaxID=104341 RepID=A0A8H7NTW5_9APHY|nr:hypothetical protein IEO21_09735 [Postia placenta]
MSRGNWYWVLPVWLLGMVPVGTNIWLLTQEIWVVLPPLGCVGIVSVSNTIDNVVSTITRVSVVASDILVVAATWYYISRTSSVQEQLVRDIWAARPNLTAVMFRDGTLYFLIISLLNIVVLIVNTISFSSLEVSSDTSNPASYRMSSILISHFLICIREAAERSIQAFNSHQSLSFIDSQGDSVPHRWLSTIEFAADIANPSSRDSNTDLLSDPKVDPDSRGEDYAVEEGNHGIELTEFAASTHSVHTRTS